MKYCKCGCGGLAPIYTNTSRGRVKGEYANFIHGHNRRGHKHTAEALQKMSVVKSGENHPGWKGDGVGYSGLHMWVIRHKRRTGICFFCGSHPTRTEFANVSGEYRRDVDDFIELCSPCHWRYDEMMDKGKMVCPACETKLSVSKHYDAVYEWFECSKCEGCFTWDEILEGGGEALVEDVGEEIPSPPKVVAKKKNAPQEEEEEEHKPQPVYYSRGELPTREVVNIIADEIQTIHAEMGNPVLDDLNAQEKALQLVRVLRTQTRVKITEGEVPHVLCENHSA